MIFTGNYRVRTYTATDGASRLSHDVWVDDIGANIAIHDLALFKTENTANAVKSGDTAKTGESPNSQPATPTLSSTTAQTQGIHPSNHNAIAPHPDFSTAATNAVNAGNSATIPPDG